MSELPSSTPKACSAAGTSGVENGAEPAVNRSNGVGAALPPGDSAPSGTQQKAPPPQGEKPQSQPPPSAADEAPQVARAEELVDKFAERVASFTSTWGRRIWRLTARVREEAEDIWGEAQSIRKGDQA